MNTEIMRNFMLIIIVTGFMQELITGILNRKITIGFICSLLLFSDPAQISPWEMGSKFNHAFFLIFPFFAFYYFGYHYVSISYYHESTKYCLL